MTAQAPDRLESEYPGLALGAWRLYGVFRGEPGAANQGRGGDEVFGLDPGVRSSRAKGSVEVHRRAGGGSAAVERVEYERAIGAGEYEGVRHRPGFTSSANWKGFVRAYRLTRGGRLVLERIDYDAPGCPPDLVGRAVDGDFYLVLRPHFFGPRVFIPFRGGAIVANRSAWSHTPDGSPVDAVEFRRGCHPDFPSSPRKRPPGGPVPDDEETPTPRRPRRGHRRSR